MGEKVIKPRNTNDMMPVTHPRRKSTLKSEAMSRFKESVQSVVSVHNNLDVDDNNLLMNEFWSKNKNVPYVGLIMMCLTFLTLMFVYFTNSYKLLFGGIVPCIVGIIVIIPIYYFFRKYDVSLKYKNIAIDTHIEDKHILKEENCELQFKNTDLVNENQNLSTDLLEKIDEITEKNKTIYDLKKKINFNKRQSELFIKKLSIKNAAAAAQQLKLSKIPLKNDKPVKS